MQKSLLIMLLCGLLATAVIASDDDSTELDTAAELSENSENSAVEETEGDEEEEAEEPLVESSDNENDFDDEDDEDEDSSNDDLDDEEIKELLDEDDDEDMTNEPQYDDQFFAEAKQMYAEQAESVTDEEKSKLDVDVNGFTGWNVDQATLAAMARDTAEDVEAQQANEELLKDAEGDFGYSRSEAYTAAKLSEHVYDEPKTGNSITFRNQKYTVRKYYKHHKTSTFGALYENGNNVYLVFKGSAEAKDWIMNLKFKLRTCNIRGYQLGGRAHSGFQECANAILNTNLRNDLNYYKGRGKALIVSGHSLGAAVATLVATDISRYTKYGRGFKVITFGSPRVGDSTFASRFNNLFTEIRFTNEFKGGVCPWGAKSGQEVADEDDENDFWRRRRRRGGFFKKVAKGVKKVAKKVAKGAKKVAKKVAKGVKKVVKAVTTRRYGYDLVTRIPLKVQGYRHVKQEYFLNCGKTCIAPCCHWYNLIVKLQCHSISRYINALK